MSIPKNMRKEAAKTNAFYSLYELSKDLQRWMIHDFGVGYRSTDYKVFVHGLKMELADEDTLNTLHKKYDFKVETSFPQWLIEHYREKVIKLMDDAVHYVSDAYYMYPQTMYEFNVRKQRFTDAINSLCYLKVVMQEAIDVFPSNLERYIPYVNRIDDEIKHIKSMRKNANTLRKACLLNDAGYIREHGGVYYNPGLYYGIINSNPYINSLNNYQLVAVSNFINGYYKIFNDNGLIKSNSMIPCCFIVDENQNIIDYCVK